MTRRVPNDFPFAVGSRRGLFPGLSKLTEEVGELGQVVGRLMQGLAIGMDKHWDGDEHKRRLVEEMADVYAAIHFVISANDLDREEFFRLWNDKLQTFYGWHREQMELREKANG